MNSFDIIDAAGFGYKTVWQERAYLAKLAIVPVMIKIACAVVVIYLGYGDNFLRQGLISLPAAFAEGWLLAQFMRTLLLLERWPIILKEEPSDQEMSALLLRARGIISSTLTFALIALIGYGMKAVYLGFYQMADAAGTTAPDAQAQANPLMFIPAFLLIIATIWLFRLLWLYIPVVVLMPMGEFLKRLGGLMASFRMVGVFMIGMVPCFLLGIVLANVFTNIVGGPETDIGRFVLMLVTVFIETLINLITTASMVYFLRGILPKHPAALPDFGKD